MAQLNEMDAELAQLESQEDPDDKMQIDLMDGIRLITQAKVLMDYISDPDLCKNVSKRERDGMGRLSEKMKSYLDEMEVGYSES